MFKTQTKDLIMKKVLLSALFMMASVTSFAQDIDNCYTMQVPALMSIMGQAPSQKAYVQISSNAVAGTMIKVLTTGAVGNAMFASMCVESRGDITCAKPFMGKGAVQFVKMQNILNLNKVELTMEKSTIATKILGTHQNLKLSAMSCSEFIKIFGQ